MLSATLQDGLGEYGIGAKIRTLRLKKKMGLVELGSTPVSRRRCSRRSSAGACSRRCRRCCASRWSSASAWNSSSPAPREAARRHRAQGGAGAVAGASWRARHRIPIRVARLTPHPSAVSTPTSRSSCRSHRHSAAAHPSGRRVHLRAEGNAARANRGRRTRPRSWRLDLFRLEHLLTAMAAPARAHAMPSS